MAKFHRIARLLEMMDLIRSDKNLRAKDLSEHFGVSEKRIYDDIAELNSAGIPVVFENRGYRVLGQEQSGSLGFSSLETRNIYMALWLMRNHGPCPDSLCVSNVYSTILERISPNVRSQAAQWHETMMIQESKANKVNKAVLHAIFSALEQQEIIEIEYYSASRAEETCRQVDPYLLAHLRSSWYLVGLCHLHEKMRTFKLLRIRKVTPTGRKFKRPEDFTASSYFHRTWGAFLGELVTVEIRFDPSVATYIMEKQFSDNEILRQPDGGIILRTQTRGLEEIGWWVLQYGAKAEVLSPPELRDKIAQVAKDMAGVYQKDYNPAD